MLRGGNASACVPGTAQAQSLRQGLWVSCLQTQPALLHPTGKHPAADPCPAVILYGEKPSPWQCPSQRWHRQSQHQH